MDSKYKLFLVLPVVALLAAGCGSSAQPTSQQTPTGQNQQAVSPPAATDSPMQPAATSITINNFAFSPASLTVKKGTMVTWTNNDSATHTVTGDNGGPASGNLANGNSYSYTFDQTGTFPYHCSIHPNMKASVTVTQ